jgi:Activator of Hsp90 ATPase homolog 1-like protein
MRTVISQSVVLPAPAEGLFAMYTDPAKHAAITGAPVAISVEPGSPFQAFNGALTGATLQIIPQRLVIQSWRSTKFNDGDPDSTLILAFTPEGANGRIDLVHLDVPAHNCRRRFLELTSETSLRSERGASRLAGSISTLVRDLNSVLAIIIGIVG